jgi:predicted Zn-dependent protease
MIAIAFLSLALQQPDSARLRVALERSLKDTTAVGMRRTEALLDTVVLQRAWGARALNALRRRYPASAMLLEFDARRATREERWDDALAMRERLIRLAPADTTVQRGYAELLERAGKNEEAKRAYLRWFETAPENDAPFRALLRLHADYNDLLERVQRMKIRLPDTQLLKEHETELLHKLGRKP